MLANKHPPERTVGRGVLPPTLLEGVAGRNHSSTTP